ncbi:hypothetical protein BH09VER1_BH09VER1_14730 [soil metagenome]
MEIDFQLLWDAVTAQYAGSLYSIHGPAHWRRVEQNGLLLAERTGADVTVVKLFAVFHDSRRLNEGTDEGHGARGAIYAAEVRGTLFSLDDARFALLREACIGHTDELHSDNATIGTCWDADRLDLGRVGIIPDGAYMSTAFGQEIARAGSIYSFLPK